MNKCLYIRKVAAQRHKGFTIVELLVVIAIVLILLAMLLPALARARMQSQIVRVQSDLRQITMAVQMYLMDNANQLPPTRFSCNLRPEQYELPPELAQYGYLPHLPDQPIVRVNFIDPFCPEDPVTFTFNNTYRYRAPGTAIVNEFTLMPNAASLYVPDGYPAVASQTGQYYYDPKTCPIRYAIWSVGPGYDPTSPNSKFYVNGGQAPVPSRFWCNGAGDTGVIMHAVNVRGADVMSP